MNTSNRIKPAVSRADVPAVIAIVDADMHQRQSLSRGVSLYGHRCVSFASHEEMMDAISKKEPPGFDVLIVDVSNDFRSGLDLVRQLRTLRSALPIIAIRGLEWDARMKTMEAETTKLTVIQRPFTAMALVEEIEKLLK
jgi:FixJ family two-component response regulator